MQVPSGYVVEAYSQENFRGSSARYVGNVARINGTIRSLRISRETNNNRPDYADGRDRQRDNNRRSTNSGKEVLVYTDINYVGDALPLTEGRYRSLALRNLARQASSIGIPAGYKVQIFESDNFTGHSYTFTNSVSDLRTVSWNDRAASIIISRGR
ncbi:hypothetical protein GCM10028807_48840 [Spirosoma daeguense]